MEDRLKHLLRCLVEDVIDTGEPVGSQHLVDSFDLDMSPATVRNWFAELEDGGYIFQPHTSSGRMPTEKGYRLYLQELMRERALRQRELERVRQTAAFFEHTGNQLMRAARAMADLIDGAAILSHEDETVTTGLSRLLAQPEFSDRDELLAIGDAIDRADDMLAPVRHRHFDEPTALIGRDCPFGERLGSVFLSLDDDLLVGILGPMRMDYSRAFAMLRKMKGLME